jgi:transcriptional regulator with XRE-family HTH domain
MSEEQGDRLSQNVRFLLWRRDVRPDKWQEHLRGLLPAVWSDADLRAALNGGRLNYARIADLVAALGVAEQDLVYGDLLRDSGTDVLVQNLRYLVGALERGGKKELASYLGIDPSTVSRWLSNASRPPAATLRELAAFFRLGADVDLATTPLFLSPVPASIAEMRRWLHERLETLTPDEVREMFPALRRMLEPR